MGLDDHDELFERTSEQDRAEVLERERDALREQVDDLAKEREILASASESHLRRINGLEASWQKERDSVAALHDECERLREAKVGLEKNLALGLDLGDAYKARDAAIADAETLRQRVADLEAERDKWREDARSHQGRIDKLEAENRSLEDALEEARRDRFIDQDAKAIYESAVARIEELEAELEKRGPALEIPRTGQSVPVKSMAEAQVARVGQQVWDALCLMGTDGVDSYGSEHLTDLMIDIATAMGKLKAG